MPPDRLLTLAVAAATLCGCATVRDARLAEDPANAVPGERTPTAKELGLPVRGLLKLDDAVSAALRAHPSVVRARREEEQAAARVGEAESAFLPDTSVSASLDYRNQTPNTTPTTTEKHRFVSGGFQLSWLVFDFGRTPAQYRQTAAQWVAAQADARTAEVEAAFGVRAAYYELVKQIRLLQVAQDAVGQFEVHLDQVREFVLVGTRIPYDQTKAEVDVGNARLTLVRTQDAVLLAQATLANSMGLAETTDWVPEASSAPAPQPRTFEDAWRIARGSRPAIVAAAAREEASLQLVEAQIAALWPSLSLGAGFSAAGNRLPLPWSWHIGPSVSWTPFDGFRNLYSIDEAAAGLRAARTQRASVEQQTWLEVRTAWLALEDATRRLELTALVTRSAEENLRLAQGRFEVGTGTAVELTDAQQALTQARSDDVQARADHDLAVARLARALGTTTLGPAPEPGRNR